MLSRDIRVTKDAGALNAAAANLFVDIGRESIALRGTFSVSLAGGSTPRKLYSLLASDVYKHQLDWTLVSFFFGDERHVPPESDQSNYRMANETLFTALKIGAEQVHRWPAELPDALEAADQYEAELWDHFKSPDPVFDLMLLGLGDDGHTASLFPNTGALSDSKRSAVANWVEKLDAFRLTLTPRAINAARNVVFLVSGVEKATAVARILEGEFRPEEFPAQLVLPDNGSLYWLLDEAAASLLDGNQN